MQTFGGLSWTEVNAMRLSDFTKLVKCATMLTARNRLANIRVFGFANMKEQDRSSFLRELKSTSTLYMEKKLKDYRVVLGNLAKRMMANGRG